MLISCFVSQRYWKMKAIHNLIPSIQNLKLVVLYPKDTEKWKQFTTLDTHLGNLDLLFCIPKILKNESNSQPTPAIPFIICSCFVSQRYWKMKAIHNGISFPETSLTVVLYPKDTEKWKQFTTFNATATTTPMLFCIPKILKNESNSQLLRWIRVDYNSCFVSQRYWKMKAIHNAFIYYLNFLSVVLYPKDTEKWKQFTTIGLKPNCNHSLFCIPKILKNESNSQRYHILK